MCGGAVLPTFQSGGEDGLGYALRPTPSTWPVPGCIARYVYKTSEVLPDTISCGPERPVNFPVLLFSLTFFFFLYPKEESQEVPH